MTVPHKAQTAMTADAFLVWSEARPDGSRFELLDGVVFAMSAERLRHARLKADVYSQFKRRIAEAGLSCEAMVDGMAVRVDETTVFEPDALVRCGPRLPDDVLSIDDPVIVVEVVSPSSQRVDVLLKLTRYFRNPHIVHYLIVVPEGRTIIHHRRGRDGGIVTMSYDEGTITLDPPGLAFSTDDLFAESA